MLRFDLHVHTDHSKDGMSSTEEVLRAAAAAGLDGVAITDHNTTAGAKHALDVVNTVAPGLLIIPGEEVSTRSGHLIVLGITTDIPGGLSLEDTIKEARRLDGTIIVPHPYYRSKHGMPIPEDADAAEIYNSRHVFGIHNRITMARARALGLPGVAGSDAHHARLVGNAITLVNADRNTKDVLEAIKQGKTAIDVKKTPVFLYALQLANGWVKKLRMFFIR